MDRLKAKDYVGNYPKPFLRQYVWDYDFEKGIEFKRGAVVAIYDEKAKAVDIGWSLCHGKDHFDKYIGVFVALKRAEGNAAIAPGLRPTCWNTSVEEVMDLMVERCLKYFKQIEESNELGV